jgi:NADH dehydrogenase
LGDTVPTGLIVESAPRVVIVGAGFGGLACAKALANTPVRVTVVDKRNYHLFVPLLYQVATAALSPADISRPVRRMLGRYRNIEVILGEAVAVDAAQRTVRLRDGPTLAYDRLVLASGGVFSYFGHPEWAALAPGPGRLDDARKIRARLLTAFEQAEITENAGERERLMTIVIVGGGPTGVEMAGSVAELARYALARDFRRIDPARAHIVLIEAGPRILTQFPEKLAAYAQRVLESLSVQVLLNHAVEAIDARGVTVAGRRIEAATVIWGAGVRASDAGMWLGIELDKAGRILVGRDLAVRGIEGVYALGDTARLANASGETLPALAQVAKQQGRHLGRALAAHFADGQPLPPFRYRNRGNTAIIGRNTAVFDFGWWQFKGRLAWLLWAIIHVYLLVGFENRLVVTTRWVWRYLTYERGARLIMPEAE